MLSPKDAKTVADFFQLVDNICREDMSKGDINNERDYVSHFMAYLKRPDGIKNPGRPIIARAITLPSREERLFGADGLIVFRKENETKQTLFEAKYCKIKQNGTWDQILPGMTQSHFTDQLIRQKKWSHQFAIWEIFQNNYPNGYASPYNFIDYGSTCVWHEDAENHAHLNNYKKKRKAWTNKRLEPLLKSASKDIAEIIHEILICHKGQKLTVNEKIMEGKLFEYISIEASDEEVHVPFPKGKEFNSEDILNESEVLSFMKETGIMRYIYFDINEETLNYIEEIVHRAEKPGS